MRRTAAASGAAHVAASRSGPRIAVPKNRPPRSAIRRRTIFVAVEASQNPLKWTEAAVAMRTGELAVALITRIAAIGRIALPFVAIDLAAAAAAAQAAA